MGFVIAPGSARSVLIRAVGPGLAGFGVPGPLVAAPVVTLYAGGEPFLANTRWNTAANAADIRAAARQVGAFALTDGSADSAILASLSPGAYTLQIAATDGTAGTPLAEVFEGP